MRPFCFLFLVALKCGMYDSYSKTMHVEKQIILNTCSCCVRESTRWRARFGLDGLGSTHTVPYTLHGQCDVLLLFAATAASLPSLIRGLSLYGTVIPHCPHLSCPYHCLH